MNREVTRNRATLLEISVKRGVFFFIDLFIHLYITLVLYAKSGTEIYETETEKQREKESERERERAVFKVFFLQDMFLQG